MQNVNVADFLSSSENEQKKTFLVGYKKKVESSLMADKVFFENVFWDLGETHKKKKSFLSS